MNAEAIINDLAARGVRVWAEKDKLKLDAPVGILTDEDKAKLAAAKTELLAALSRPGNCPTCHSPATLQRLTLLTFWCAGCRAFSDGQGQPLPPIPYPQPSYREEIEARKLFEDLRAAGCGISWDGDELRITNLARITTALWLRLESADSDFLRLAHEMAETIESEEASKWVN